MSSVLDEVVFSYEQKLDAERIGKGVQERLEVGDTTGARVLLDAAELQSGSWLEQSARSLGNTTQLGVVHLFVLLIENDLHAARHLAHRIQCSSSQTALTAAVRVYELLWNDGTVVACEYAQKLRKDFQHMGSLVLGALELLIARFQARQLDLMQRAYSTISVDSFGNNLGLSSKEHVDKFCAMPPDDRFEVRGEFVHVSRSCRVENKDTSAQIRKLTNLVVFLEGETTTFISSKLPTEAAGTTSSSSIQ